MTITLKHSGASYPLDVSSVSTATELRDLVARTTGVPADRVKVMLPKGKGVMKDDFNPKTLKDGATLTAVGSATAPPQPPPEPRVFLEDLEEGGEAVIDTPAGLLNLGNTCYMNSTIQTIGCIEELRTELLKGNATGGPLVQPLATLTRSLEATSDGVNPMSFLTALRAANPQFAERDRSEKSAAMMSMGMGGYSQQDAEESYSYILNSLRSVKKDNVPVVEKYAMGVMRRTLKAADGSDDASSSGAEEDFLKLECNITRETGDLLGGLRATLTQTIVKNSPVTGAPADYIQTSRIARLPKYLSVHMVRFAWRPDIGKRTKVMRKVKFPLELDALELCTDELKAKLTLVNRKLGEIGRARRDRAKIHARRKGLASEARKTGGGPAGGMGGTSGGIAVSGEATSVAGGEDPNAMQVDEEEDEFVIRTKEAEELKALTPQDIKNDIGASESGLYDLVAIITHKGAAADSGHYMAFVKKSVFQKRIGAKKDDPFDDDEDWYRFDDDKVTIFPKDKIATLDGGGEDSSAYVLLYKSRPLE